MDGLRALAVVAVVLFHARVPGSAGGFLGVDAFFVLSGYLITRLLREEQRVSGRVDILRFYGRRLRRLYPALLLLVFGYLATAWFAFPETTTRQHLGDAAKALFYISNFSMQWGQPLPVLGHTWSLAIEAQFYLLWPLVMILLSRVRAGVAMLCITLLFVATTIWRAQCFQSLSDPWVMYFRLDTHSSGLLLGCLLGYVDVRIRTNWALLGLVGLVLAMFFFQWRAPATAFFGFTMAEACSALIVAAHPRWLSGKYVVWLGRMSYGIYLWHYPLVLIARRESLGWEAALAMGLLGGVAMAAISHYLIERRFHAPRSRAVV